MPRDLRAAVDEAPWLWQFEDEFGAWQQMDDDVQEHLRAEYWRTRDYPKEHRVCEIERVLRCGKIDKYQVNFHWMSEKNLKTKKERYVRAVKMWVWKDQNYGHYEGPLGTGQMALWQSWSGEQPGDLNIPARLLWQVGAAV